MQLCEWAQWQWTISPNRPLRIMFSTARLSRRKLQFSSIMQGTPVASCVFTRSQHWSSVMAQGTSTAAYLPAFIAQTAIGVCHSQGVAMITASRSLRSIRRLKSSSPLV